MLFVQADGGLGAVFFSVKQAEKMAVIFPVPAGITYMHEPFVLDLASNITERRKSIRRRRTFRAKLFFLWEPQGTNPRENFEPGKKKPAYCGCQSPHPTAPNKENGEVGGDQNPERAGLLCIRILKSAQAETEHRHAKCKKDAKKHLG